MRLSWPARALIVFAGTIVLWQVIIWLTGLPPYLLPAPDRVAVALYTHGGLIAGHAMTTLAEIVLGLLIGAAIGAENALIMIYYPAARRWMMPLLLTGLAFPVFAIAPILVLWLGFDMTPKVVMVALIIYFPVTAAFYDGLRRTDPGWLDLGHVMNGSRWATLRLIRIPAALPALASGLRISTALAPNAAAVGEWVGSSTGLGFLMLHANARTQIDVMFAALFVLAVLAVSLYLAVDAGLRRLTRWQTETSVFQDPPP